MTESLQPRGSLPFRDLTWRNKWLIVAGMFLVLWYSVRFLDPEWLLQWPKALLLLFGGGIPQLFLLLFPFLTHDKPSAGRIRIPGIKRCLIELAIALPIVIVTIVALGCANYLVRALLPGKTLTPDVAAGMAASPPRLIYPLLLLLSILAPVAEEVFFRGFIYNAFRKRMPTIVAGLVQSSIFGFCHFFGTTHAVIAVALGLVLTAFYEWRKTLIAPILVHSSINVVFAVGVLAMMVQHANHPTIGVVGNVNDTECIIREVIPDSAAAESGIMVGDRIVAFDGQSIATFPELIEAASNRQPNDKVSVSLVRDGETLSIDVTLMRRGDTTQSP